MHFAYIICYIVSYENIQYKFKTYVKFMYDIFNVYV